MLGQRLKLVVRRVALLPEFGWWRGQQFLPCGPGQERNPTKYRRTSLKSGAHAPISKSRWFSPPGRDAVTCVPDQHAPTFHSGPASSSANRQHCSKAHVVKVICRHVG